MTGALPWRLSYASGQPLVEWVPFDGSRPTEPFFEETVARIRCGLPAAVRAGLPRTPLDALSDTVAGARLTALIFHVSRCGSTLVSQMLAALPRHIVVSEPTIVDDILRTAERNPRIGDEERIAWLRGALNALSQTNAARSDRLFVKLSCWHLFSLPLLQRAFPDVPMLLVFRPPLEVLVSLMSRPSPALIYDTIAPALLGLSVAARSALSREDYAAAVIGALYRTALKHRAVLVPVPYEQLPARVGIALSHCAFTAEELDRLEAAASWDAKNPRQRFEPDTAGKRRRVTPALAEACARWAEPDYQRWVATL